MATRDLFALSNAILEAVGIDSSTVTSLKFEHSMDGIPMLTVERIVTDSDVAPFINFTQEWVPKDSLRESTVIGDEYHSYVPVPGPL